MQIKDVEIVRILETKATSGGFESRSVHVKTDEQYPQVLDIQFTQGKVVELDKFSPGQKVKIDINLRGREWTAPSGEISVFNTIQGWKIEEVK
jgi:translation initiation factor IF-3